MQEIEITGPYVQVAAFCQMAFPDSTGSLSVIRLIDRYTVTGSTPEMPPSPVHVTLAVVLKAGFMIQKSKVTFRPVTPSGKSLPELQFDALFEGQERGVVIALPFGMMLSEEGLYWCEIAVDGQVLTKIPLRVMYQRTAPGLIPGTQAQ